MEPARRSLRPLILLNAALLAGLSVVSLAPSADAQNRRARAKGQYTMVDAKFLGSVEAAVVIHDSANQELLALRWDRSRKSLTPIGLRDLAADADAGQKGGR